MGKCSKHRDKADSTESWEESIEDLKIKMEWSEKPEIADVIQKISDLAWQKQKLRLKIFIRELLERERQKAQQEILQKLTDIKENHCCRRICNRDCGKEIHGYCGYELGHGIEIEDILDVITNLTQEHEKENIK